MNFYPFVPATAFVLNVFLLAFICGQRRRNPVNHSFLFFIAWTSAWILVETIFHLPISHGLEVQLHRLSSVFWIPSAIVLLNFVYFLLRKKRDGLFYVFLIAAIVGVGLSVSTDLVVRGFVRYDWGIAAVRGPLHTWISMTTGIAGLVCLALIWRAMRRATRKKERGAYLLILVGGSATITICFSLNVILPNFVGVLDSPRVGSAALTVFCYFVYRAVYRYNFLAVTLDQVAMKLFDDVRSGVIIVDQMRRVKSINSSARAMLRFHPGEAVGKPIAELFDYYPQAESFRGKETSFGKDRDTKYFEITQSAVTRSDIEIGKIVLLRDITVDKHVEATLRRSRDDLEVEVEQRTEELRQAQKMEAIGALAGGIAHDFNNLLAAILGFATAAQEDLPAGSPLRKDMDEVLHAARRARDIVQQLLTFSRHDEFRPEVVEIDVVVEEALKLLAVSLPATIQIRRQIQTGATRTMGDPTQINQIIMNLCTNSYYAMKETGGELVVRLANEELNDDFTGTHPPLRPGGHVHLEIGDTGCGMTDETRRRIFDPFFTTKPYGEGTGLGMSTVLTAVENHQGIIDIHSEVGVGTTFHVYLPAIDQTAAEDELEAPGIPRGVERILLVDDEDQLARVGKRLLEPLGYRVTALTNSFEAWLEIRDNPDVFDLVITDQTMPQMSGTELAAEISQIRSDLPLILLSGYPASGLEQRARTAGVRAFLPKPVSKRELGETVRRLLDENQSGV